MADNNSALGPLPNGWECRNDPRTRRNYFINFNNKTTTWEDPRVNPSFITAPPPYHEPQEHLTMQPQLHGTPDHRSVYPTNPTHYQTQLAFHMPNPYMQEILRQDISNFRPSPVAGRAHTAPLMGSHAISHHNNSKIQETSFSTAVATEQSVAKLSAMFPTVSETHIRALLIKYHSREAVVISALQVEKNPITTPGPFSTPPLARHIIVPPSILPPNYHSTPTSGLRDFVSTPPPSLYSYGYGTGCGTMTGSPASSSCMGSPAIRHSPRPHSSSPKMKLRYMKSMFPKADETIILDTLYNVDNNVQAATNQLQAMGFDKRDSTSSRSGTPSLKIKEAQKNAILDKEKSISISIASARLLSVEEKQKMCTRLKTNYPDLAEQLVSMALDSVDYDENRASHILNLMIKEEGTPKSTKPNSACSSQNQGTVSINSQSACSSQEPSKSDNAEASSLETKTTVEADVLLGDNKDSLSHMNHPSSCSKENSPYNGLAESLESSISVEGAMSSGPADTTISATTLVHSPTNKVSFRKLKGKKDVPKVSRGTSTTEDKEYRSPYRQMPAGPNSVLHHGPNDELLIEDYVSWAGPQGRAECRKGLAKGPNKSLLSSQRCSAKGPSRDIYSGPQRGLAKGSLYSHLAASNVATAIIVGESRGK